jgi:hypothetical protein
MQIRPRNASLKYTLPLNTTNFSSTPLASATWSLSFDLTLRKPKVYTEGVGEFQPRVELWQPWGEHTTYADIRNPERAAPPRKVKAFANPFRVLSNQSIVYIPGLPKLNPGLKFANTFGVMRRFGVGTNGSS